LLEQEGGTFVPAAVWPSPSSDVTHLAPAAQQCLGERRGLVLRQQGLVIVAYPVELEGQVQGAVVLDVAERADAALQAVLRQLHWGIGWIETLFLRRRRLDDAELLQRARRYEHLLAPALRLDDACDAFQHAGGRDLTGYEDGTENPVGDAARYAALVADDDPALAASSFVAVQRWRHDFARFERMPRRSQDLAIGRRRTSNEEIDDAPPSAHVKRTAQESFAPPAFILRRSMPWAEGNSGGLVFVAFAASFAPFEAQLRRMLGLDDGVVDALFAFTRPESGAYFWCPAMRDGQPDLRPLGIAG